MKRFLRFLALCLIGFCIGAGIAMIVNRNNAPAPQPVAASGTSAPGKTAAAPAVTTDAQGKIVLNKEQLAKAQTGGSETDKKLAQALGGNLTDKTPAPETLTGVEGMIANETLTGEPAKPAATAAAADATPKTVIPPTDLPPRGVGEGYFSLIDQNGMPVTEKSWPDKYLLVFFGFTHCPDICPVTLQKISTVLDKLGPDAAKLQTLFITVDPARDTPDVMKKYIANFDKSIVGLTGTESQIKDAEDDFKVYAAKVPTADGKDYSMNHSGFVYLMSPRGKMVELLKIEDSTDTVLNKIKPHLANPDIDSTAPPAPNLP